MLCEPNKCHSIDVLMNPLVPTCALPAHLKYDLASGHANRQNVLVAVPSFGQGLARIYRLKDKGNSKLRPPRTPPATGTVLRS